MQAVLAPFSSQLFDLGFHVLLQLCSKQNEPLHGLSELLRRED